MALIKTKDLCQAANGRDILTKVNIEVQKGEIFAVIGPTGAGKTTLLRLLNLLDKPSSGQVFIDDTDISEMSRNKLELRRRMAFVLQKPVVFNMSVYDNIAVVLKWRGTDKEEIRERTEAIMEDTGLTEYRSRNARTLSGGETQRVAIARALITRPDILLLDEPGANLDPVTFLKMEEFITETIRKYETTTVMATHDMAQGQRMADHVAVMMNGEILQTGTWNDVFNKPKSVQVASFVGVENIIEGRIVSASEGLVAIEAGSNSIEAVSSLPSGSNVNVLIRPEDITILTGEISSSARNRFAGKIAKTVSFGPLTRVFVDCGFTLTVIVTTRSAEEMALVPGKPVYASFKATGIHVTER